MHKAKKLLQQLKQQMNLLQDTGALPLVFRLKLLEFYVVELLWLISLTTLKTLHSSESTVWMEKLYFLKWSTSKQSLQKVWELPHTGILVSGLWLPKITSMVQIKLKQTMLRMMPSLSSASKSGLKQVLLLLEDAVGQLQAPFVCSMEWFEINDIVWNFRDITTKFRPLIS